ncbi:protein sey1 [Anaeramoeba flamelloides]|uniref:Protein sey1 n=1 Tax=Anaeramoeba flamelloides TaxID=1746091 RepID=A0ABQ8YBP4_9EUKA|nr:protein sey1 [Anaeramoeba flamelloides]
MTNDFKFQIVNENADFLEDTKKSLEKSPIYNKGHNYCTLGIMGCQSSGKSTLLNLLFDTSFTVMNNTLGRQQTTQGIWVSNSGDGELLVFDIEGTDSAERGANHRQFERKSTLFSMAIAEVLIINIWEADIGRYQASNYELLKTVFEVNLELFASEKNKENKFYVFKPEYKRGIPADGLPEYLSNIWQTIQDNKIINIPSQKELVALYRCEEIKNNCLEDFLEKENKLIIKPLKKGYYLNQFGFDINNLFEEIIEQYKIPASGYLEYVMIQKLGELKEEMEEELLIQFRLQLQNAINQLEKQFENGLKKKIPTNSIHLDFIQLTVKLSNKIIKRFENVISNSRLKGADWETKSELDELKSYIEDRINFKQNEMKIQIIEEYFLAINKRLKDNINPLFGNVNSQTNSSIIKKYQNTTSNLKNLLNSDLKRIQIENQEIEISINKFVKESLSIFSQIIKKHVMNIQNFMTKKFDEKFKYDEKHIPRDYTAIKDLGLLYEESIDDGLIILEYLQTFKIPILIKKNFIKWDDTISEFETKDYNEENQIIEQNGKIIDLKNNFIIFTFLNENQFEIETKIFNNQMEISYKEAILIQRSKKTDFNVPNILWVLLVIIARSDIHNLITNPVYSIFIVLICSIIFLLWKYNLLSTVTK